MKTRLSPEAAHAKYEYNKKYQTQYWEDYRNKVLQ